MSVESWLEDAERRRSEHWATRVREFLHDKPFTDPDGIVFLGDSITEGFPLAKHFPGVNVINRGIGGDTVTGLLERLALSTSDLSPGKLFVMIGVNDIFNMHMTAEQVKHQQMALLAALIGHLPHAEIFIQSVLPVGDEWAAHRPTIHSVNQALVDFSDYFGMTFVDLHPAFASEEGGIKPELTDDGVHLTDAGYDLWASEIKSLVSG